MIQPLVDRFIAGRDELRARFAAAAPNSLDYMAIVRMVVETISEGCYGQPDPTRLVLGLRHAASTRVRRARGAT
jgi:hypothetical protein